MKVNADLKKSSFEVIPGTYYYAKIPRQKTSGRHFMISDDGEEITIVTKHLPKNIIERNKEKYSLIKLNVYVPFYSVGFLAAVSKAIADAGMDILIVSTYSKDYILVRKEDEKKAVSALKMIGLKVK